MKAMTKWALALLMFAWGGLSFFFLAGEDSPEQPLSLTAFFTIKLASLGSFYMWGRVLGYLLDRDLLPSCLVPDDPKEEEEDCYE